MRFELFTITGIHCARHCDLLLALHFQTTLALTADYYSTEPPLQNVKLANNDDHPSLINNHLVFVFWYLNELILQTGSDLPAAELFSVQSRWNAAVSGLCGGWDPNALYSKEPTEILWLRPNINQITSCQWTFVRQTFSQFSVCFIWNVTDVAERRCFIHMIPVHSQKCAFI